MNTTCTCTPEVIGLSRSAVEEFGSGVAYRHAADCAVTVAYVHDQQVENAEHTLDKLDTEDDDTQRALLIDHVISLADINADVARMWQEYR